MNPLESKNYPTVMYFLITLVLVLIFFSFISIAEEINQKIEQKTKVTGFATYEFQNKTNESLTNKSSGLEKELPTAKSYFMFYFVLMTVILSIIVVTILLKSTIIRNIELEEEGRRF